MHLAALLDLGVPQSWLREALSKLPVTAEYELMVAPGKKMGISGTRAEVTTVDSSDHRHHSSIVKMIHAAGYSAQVESRALSIFSHIANAEGKIHGVSPDKVHFHEVGAVDSIVDIVAAALCIDYLNPEFVLCSAVEVGSGYVDCAHGRFPVPAPATQEMLAKVPCTYGNVRGESTTPTGAAILAASVDEYLPKGLFLPSQVGYGIGHKDFELPNVLRVVHGVYTPTTPARTREHFQIEANIDDMTAEAFEPLMDTLFAAGAADVFLTPIVMKKSRAAHCLTVLCPAAHKDLIVEKILNQSSTIGLRVFTFAKHVLPRESLSISTSLGQISVKIVTQPDGRRRWKSEHNDIIELALTHNLDYQTVKATVEFEVRQQLQDAPHGASC